MHISAYYPTDMVNGPGVRCTLFVSGCEHHCKGCYNARTWRADHGVPFTQAHLQQVIADLNSVAPPRHGLSLSGGDPLLPANCETVAELVRTVRAQCPGKSIWCWTGYELETLTLAQQAIVDEIDVLIDGRFEQALCDPNLPWRGSRNQRIIPLTGLGRQEIAAQLLTEAVSV